MTSPHERRVLLSADVSTGPLAAVRGLSAAGYEPWVAAHDRQAYAARSGATAGVVPVPDPDDNAVAHARALAEVAARIGAAAVLPGTENSLHALTGREAWFSPGIAVGTSGEEAFARATDKALLERLAEEAGLETPRTADVSASEVESAADELGFPVVLKPSRSIAESPGGKLRVGRVRRVDGLEDLRAILATAVEERWLVQPFLAGELGAVCGVSWRGELVCAVHQRSSRIWPVDVGTSSHATTVSRDSGLEAGVARLLRAVGSSGVFGVQFLRAERRRYLIDFNPRIYGSLALAVAAGCNLPAIWADLLLGAEPTIPDYRVGVRYRALGDDYRALATALPRGDGIDALLGALPRRGTVHAVFTARDPWPLATSLAKLGRWLLRRSERGGRDPRAAIRAPTL